MEFEGQAESKRGTKDGRDSLKRTSGTKQDYLTRKCRKMRIKIRLEPGSSLRVEKALQKVQGMVRWDHDSGPLKKNSMRQGREGGKRNVQMGISNFQVKD